MGLVKVGESTSLDALRWEIGVAKLQQDATKAQGEAAVKLIESATAPPLAESGHVGTRLNVVA
jgi:hypothetical protein